jgi:adenine-specific DNA-methyltransferase
MTSSYVNPATKDQRKNLVYTIISPSGREIVHPTHAWKYSIEEHIRHKESDLLWWGRNGEAQYPRLKIFSSDASGMVPVDLWDYKSSGTTDDGGNEIKQLFNEMIFDTPKPTKLIRRMLGIIASPDAIILDFFSGSATTAHAVMQLNAEDGGKRKFIMVQLPEVCAEDSEAAKAGYKNICEIGKERIRRAGAKTKANSPLTTTELDTGFRVLKLDSSNMKDVYYTPQEVVQMDISGLIDNIKEDRTPEDLLFQVMLDLGVLLSSKIETRTIGDASVFFVEDNYLIACFERVTDEIVTEIAQAKPYYAVFRDSSFASDSTLVNFEQVFKTYSPATIRKVL